MTDPLRTIVSNAVKFANPDSPLVTVAAEPPGRVAPGA